jgi:hypothetical protein
MRMYKVHVKNSQSYSAKQSLKWIHLPATTHLNREQLSFSTLDRDTSLDIEEDELFCRHADCCCHLGGVHAAQCRRSCMPDLAGI